MEVRPLAWAPNGATVAWLVAEIDLAIIERRLVAPEGCNAGDSVKRAHRSNARLPPGERSARRACAVPTASAGEYSAPEEGSLFPLDGALNLPKDSYSHGLRERLASEVARGSLTDSPQRWLPARLARKLPPARFPDFDALYQAMERDGHFWWRGIPGLGATKANAITAWLTARETVLGRQVPKTVQEKPKRPRVPVWARAASTVSTDDRTNALLPLERFAYPVTSGGLNGRAGTNRAPSGKMIDAEDDLGAVRTWLALRSEGSHTHRSYRKEAERFLLWAVVQRGKALSSLNAEDATAYRDFLAALDPASNLPWSGALPRAAWLGPRRWREGVPNGGPSRARSRREARPRR